MIERKRKKPIVCICQFCGKEFLAGTSVANTCHDPACQEKRKELRREQKRLYAQAHKAETQSLQNDMDEWRPPQKVKENVTSLSEIVKKATAMGLSYGEYVAKYGG